MMNKLLEIFKKFFNKLRGIKTLLLTEIDIMEDDDNEDSKEDIKEQFRQNLNVEKQQSLLNMQREYENEEMSEEDLELLDIMNLIELYKKQIEALDMEISIKKEKLSRK